MRFPLGHVIAIAVAISLFGCGKSGPVMLKTQGQVVKDGKNFVPEDGQSLNIVFCPVAATGEPPKNLYIANVDQKTGSFYAAGPHLKGLPPGKYRVGVELLKKKKDLFQDKYTIENSPFVFDIDPKSKPITIDLSQAPETTASRS